MQVCKLKHKHYAWIQEGWHSLSKEQVVFSFFTLWGYSKYF